MTRRRWATAILVSAVVLALGAGPALARGKKPPPQEPATVLVTMTHQGSGFATTDECGGPIAMTLDGSTLMASWEDTGLEMSFLDGCHGPLVNDWDDVYSGNFALQQQRDGTVRIGSRFDYEWEFEQVRKRMIQTSLTLYEVTGDLTPSSGFDWSPGGGGTLTGQVVLKQFHKIYKDGEWTEIGTFDVAFTVDIGS